MTAPGRFLADETPEREAKMLNELKQRYSDLNDQLEAAYADVERIRSAMSDVADEINSKRSIHDYADIDQ